MLPGAIVASRANGGSTACESGKKKAHKHIFFWPLTIRFGGGGLTVGCPGVKDLCAIFGTQGT